VFVAKTKSGDVRAAATGASQSGVTRVPAIEAALEWPTGSPLAPLDKRQHFRGRVAKRYQGSSSYRANLIKVMGQRAVGAAADRVSLKAVIPAQRLRRCRWRCERSEPRRMSGSGWWPSSFETARKRALL